MEPKKSWISTDFKSKRSTISLGISVSAGPKNPIGLKFSIQGRLSSKGLQVWKYLHLFIYHQWNEYTWKDSYGLVQQIVRLLLYHYFIACCHPHKPELHTRASTTPDLLWCCYVFLSNWLELSMFRCHLLICCLLFLFGGVTSIFMIWMYMKICMIAIYLYFCFFYCIRRPWTLS